MTDSLFTQQSSIGSDDTASSYFSPDEELTNELIKAAGEGDLDTVKRLLGAAGGTVLPAGNSQIELGGPQSPDRINVNAKSQQFPMAALHAAVKNGQEDVVRFLLVQPGIDVNVVDSGGYTPLLLAAEAGNLNILKVLFQAKNTDRSAMNMYEEDTLMCAAKSGHLEAVKYLVPQVQDFSRKNQLGYTSFTLAAREGHTSIVEHLSTLSRRDKIDINAKSEDNERTVLMLALLFGSVDLVKYLLRTKWCENLDLEATDSGGSTALMLAAAVGYNDIVETLCQFGADVNHANESTGFNPLILACKYGHPETVKILVNQRNIKIKADDYQGRNALFIASENNKLDCVCAILEKYNNLPEMVNAVTNDGKNTALTATYDPQIKLELIKANGCDVRRLTAKQTILRKTIRQDIIESGQKHEEIWLSILEKEEDFVLPILALIAEDFTERDIDQGVGKFFIEDPRCEEYRLGTKKDSEENTIYHYIAKSTFASKCQVALKALIPPKKLDSVLSLKNNRDNTLLHTAAHHGNLSPIFETILQAIKEKMDGLADKEVKEAFKIENKDKQTFIAAAIKSTSEECSRNLEKIMGSLMNLRPHGYDMNSFYNARDTGGNTLLHLAARRAKFNMISYLADKPIDERALNDAGFNPLHIAVLENNNELFEHIYRTFKHRFHINEPTGENETVLHIAAKQGNVELLQKIVQLGGDLARQDNDGHTPLHDCLQQVQLEGGSTFRERCEKFHAVWNKLIDVSVTWWCGPSFLNVPIPDEDSHLYKEFRRDAVYYLRSGIRNKRGLSVLQYGAYLGVTPCVETMITQEHIFVQKHKDGKCQDSSCQYEIEITHLLPEYGADIEYFYDGYGCFKKEIDEKHKFKGRKTTLIETLAKVKPPLKASEMLRCVPMVRLTKWQWYIYQFFSIIWFIVHCTVMGICTQSAQTEIRNFPVATNNSMEATANNSSGSSNASRIDSMPILYGKDNLTMDILILLYALLIFVLMTILPIRRLIRYLQKKFKGRKVRQEDQPKYKIYNEYVTDKGAFLSVLTYVLAFIVEQMSSILPVCFAIFAIGLFYQVESGESVTLSNYALMKGNFLLFGWLLLLVPARTYSPIYNFLSTLKFVIIKDMLPFVLFYIVITVAFSCAIQLQFQLLTHETIDNAEDSSGFHNFVTKTPTVLYELMIMTTGMDTDLKHVQHVADMFHEDNQNSLFVEALLIVYAIISVIILLNMLIAMMGTTMSIVVEKHGTGWRQYQVIQALRIRNFLLDMMYCCRQQQCTCCTNQTKKNYKSVPQKPTHDHHHEERGIIFDKIMQRKTRQDEKTKRWYLVLTRFELKEIRAKYWKFPEIKPQRDESASPDSDSELREANEEEIKKMVSVEDPEDEVDDDSVKDLEARMTGMEKKLKSIENTLASKLGNIEAILSELKSKV